MSDGGLLPQKLAAILIGQLRLDPATCFGDGALLSDLGLDSLGMLAFISGLEQEFGVSVSDRDYEDLLTFGDAVALLRRLTRA